MREQYDEALSVKPPQSEHSLEFIFVHEFSCQAFAKQLHINFFCDRHIYFL